MTNAGDLRSTNLHMNVFPDSFWKITAFALPALLILILVGGSFYASSKIAVSATSGAEFPTAAYATAMEKFSQPSGATLIDQAYLTKKALTILEGEVTQDPIRQLISSTLSELKDSLVIVRPGRFEGGNFQLIYESRRQELEAEADRLSGQLRGFYRNDFEEIRSKINRIRLQIAGWDAFRSFLSGLNIRCDLGDLPYSSERPIVSLISGHLVAITRDMRISLSDAAPVLDTLFLNKAGITLDVVEGVDLDQEQSRWKALVTTAKEKHAQAAAALKREAKERAAKQRAIIRNRVYSRWSSLLVMAFSTLVVFLYLNRYSTIIRRKGLPRTSTFEAYFSTNVTSLVLRWLALVIVIIGMIELWGFLLLQILLSGSKLPLLPLFNTIAVPALRPLSVLIGLFGAGGIIASILFSLLAPLAIGLLTVLNSWLLLLLSEYICFISNCYHVLYNLARPKDRT